MKSIIVPIFLSFIFLNFQFVCAADLQHSQQEGAVGLVALVKPDKEKELAAAATALDDAKKKRLAALGIHHLQLFTEFIGDDRILLASFDMDKDSDPTISWTAAGIDPTIKPWFDQLQATLAPHPRVKGTERLWVRCETIAQIHPHISSQTRSGKSSWSAAVTGLKVEKEAEYRNLHAQVWPGVIDAIGSAMVPRFDVFLIEFGDQPYLMYQMEYVGNDIKSDMANMSNNPVNKRWWKWTDACQNPIPSAVSRKEIWEPMEPASAPAPKFTPAQ